jgi:hypothetical protein
MKKILRSESGTVVSMAVAIVVILVSGLSTISLVGLVQTDQVQTQYQHDMIQEELLLRSENQRTHLAIEFNSERPLPERNVEIIEPGRITTYKIKNTFNVETVSNFMGYATEQVVAIKSLISAKRARLYVSKNEIPVKRMTERLLRNESLAQYQYFTDIERSENGYNVLEVELTMVGQLFMTRLQQQEYSKNILAGNTYRKLPLWIRFSRVRNLHGRKKFLPSSLNLMLKTFAKTVFGFSMIPI